MKRHRPRHDAARFVRKHWTAAPPKDRKWNRWLEQRVEVELGGRSGYTFEYKDGLPEPVDVAACDLHGSPLGDTGTILDIHNYTEAGPAFFRRDRFEFPDGSAIVADDREWAYGVHRDRLKEAHELLNPMSDSAIYWNDARAFMLGRGPGDLPDDQKWDRAK